MDAATELRAAVLAQLPLPLVHRIFLCLPVDERARTACVSRGWRAVLADSALWTHLDLEALMNRHLVNSKATQAAADALLRAATLCAQ